MDRMALATRLSKGLVPGSLSLIVQRGEHQLGAIIHPTGRQAAFDAGEQRAIELGNEQRFLRHMTRLLREEPGKNSAELGDLATWLLLNSSEWPILRPHAEGGLPIVISIQRRADLRLRFFFEVWKERTA